MRSKSGSSPLVLSGRLIPSHHLLLQRIPVSLQPIRKDRLVTGFAMAIEGGAAVLGAAQIMYDGQLTFSARVEVRHAPHGRQMLRLGGGDRERAENDACSGSGRHRKAGAQDVTDGALARHAARGVGPKKYQSVLTPAFWRMNPSCRKFPAVFDVRRERLSGCITANKEL